MTRDELMQAISISEEDLVLDKANVIQKIFCLALLNQGTDIARNVLNDYIKIRDILEVPWQQMNK
jgi:hypothetical protein